MRVARSRRQQGAALLTAIAFSAIFSLIAAGVAVYGVGSFNLAKRDTEYAAAIQLADAGINYELRAIALNQFSSGYSAPTSGSPASGSISGVTGTFSVYVTSDSAGTVAWTPSSKDVYIWSTGTANGIARKVVAHGQGAAGLFDTYAVYGINSVTFNGSGSSVVGNVGSNGAVSSSSSGSAAVNGTLYIDGPGASGPSGANVVVNPDAVNFPTVDAIVAATFTGSPSGWSYISTHNNNSNIRVFKSGTANGATPSTTNTQVIGVVSNANQISHTDINKQTNKTIILPPGDYYFTDINTSGQDKIIMDNGGLSTGTPGVIRIWMNSSTSGDTISNPFSYTATGTDAPSKFRLYYNKAATFQIDGNNASGGAFYGHNSTGNANFTITGGSTTYGAVIADNVTISGNSVVQFPSGTIGNSSDKFWLWFGFKDGYKEIPATGGVTFPDGTGS